MVELAAAIGILTLTTIPLAFAFIHEANLCRAYYYKAVAMQIVDGEMERLFAGEWRAFEPGEHVYEVKAESAKILPPGEFKLTLNDDGARLEWRRNGRVNSTVVREARFK
jgi:hypothetical protein